MTSTLAVLLWVLFSAGLMLGMWAEENQRRSSRDVDYIARWLPVARGVLRTEVFVLQGLLILLVVQPVSWVPAAELMLAGVMAGIAKAVPPESERRRWSSWIEGTLLVAWSMVAAIWMPALYPIGLRIALMLLLVLVASCVFGMGRVVVEMLSGAGAVDDRPFPPSEYVAVPEEPSRI